MTIFKPRATQITTQVRNAASLLTHFNLVSNAKKAKLPPHQTEHSSNHLSQPSLLRLDILPFWATAGCQRRQTSLEKWLSKHSFTTLTEEGTLISRQIVSLHISRVSTSWSQKISWHLSFRICCYYHIVFISGLENETARYSDRTWYSASQTAFRRIAATSIVIPCWSSMTLKGFKQDSL